MSDTEEHEETGSSLRTQLEKALADSKEAKAALVEAQAEIRSMRVKGVLDAKGVNQKVARFIPDDISDPEEIEKWLDENADVFSVKPDEVQEAPKAAEPSPVDAAEETSARRLQGLSSNAGSPTVVEDFEARVRSAKNDDEIKAIMNEARQFLLSE